MFSKKEKLPTGPSFPFIENKDGKISMAYDSIKVEWNSGTVTMTYIQDDVPIYAYTYEAEGDHVVVFKGMRGKVDIKFSA